LAFWSPERAIELPAKQWRRLLPGPLRGQAVLHLAGHASLRQRDAVYQDITPILCRQPDEIYEALPLASGSQDRTWVAEAAFSALTGHRPQARRPVKDGRSLGSACVSFTEPSHEHLARSWNVTAEDASAAPGAAVTGGQWIFGNPLQGRADRADLARRNYAQMTRYGRGSSGSSFGSNTREVSPVPLSP
jgi:hypothetical protein